MERLPMGIEYYLRFPFYQGFKRDKFFIRQKKNPTKREGTEKVPKKSKGIIFSFV
jgi:hypothetical protein